MGVALYRKYRSKSLAEIVGQEHITQTLSNALKKGAISHAYLFTGPRGTGKTSIARILANEVNSLPYDEETEHLDIIEIDAASNRRIDEIRELRERVHTAPTSAKYKVYIIDEVHMLTKEAFNALLKTLEEPPEHVIFILATTEFHKLPETIVSRTQRYTFKPVSTEQVAAHLRYIANQEKIQISDEALVLIAEHGGGSFRDSISLLDQMSSYGDEITLDKVREALGIAPEAAIRQLVETLRNRSAHQLLLRLTDMRIRGYQSGQLAKQIASVLRTELIADTTTISEDLIMKALKNLLGISASRDPDSALELALLDIIIVPSTSSNVKPRPQTAAVPKPTKAASTRPTETVLTHKPTLDVNKPAIPTPDALQEPNPIAPSPNQETTAAPVEHLDDAIWQEILTDIKSRHNTLYSTARMAKPSYADKSVTLVFDHAFHQKRANEPGNKQILTECLQNKLGSDVAITCIVKKSSKSTTKDGHAATNPEQALTTISNIFGGGELLES